MCLLEIISDRETNTPQITIETIGNICSYQIVLIGKINSQFPIDDTTCPICATIQDII